MAFASLTRHPLGLFGAALTTVSAVLILSLVAIEMAGFHGSPYLGILAFLVLPAVFVLGLALMPLGVWLQRRRERRAAASGEDVSGLPVIDLNRPHARRTALVVLLLTMVNVVIVATATYKAVEVMDGPAFCGRVCHDVMEPEYTGWQNSPHARVACVDCHIGPGADWFVRSKLSGSWQVIAVAFDLYPRPIPTPVENLRPARETCEQCHWPVKFVGDRLRVKERFADDEKNTPRKTVLLVRVGGMQGGRARGIHWHVDPRVTIRYRTDAKRTAIGDVELTREDGTKTLFRAPAAEGAAPAAEGGEWRVMDCVDCHNRPTHVFRLPDEAVDGALVAGTIDRSLPFVRREAVRLLTVPYPSAEAAREGLRKGLQAFYAGAHPDVAAGKAAAIAQAGDELGRIWSTNVFPHMKVTWGTYPNHAGHRDEAPGCFRCHDESHAADDGRTIGQDCSTCHSLLATDEENPAILEQLAS